MEERGSIDERVLEQLLAGRKEFLSFLEKRVGSRALAEDLLQEAFVRGMDRVGTLREEESARAWFYRLLRNAVIDHHRRSGASERALASFAKELDEAVPPAEVDRAVCKCVARLARTLKPEYAAALERVDVEGAPVKDFAAEAEITANNASVRLFRAREALRKQVLATCGACAEHGCLDCSCKH